MEDTNTDQSLIDSLSDFATDHIFAVVLIIGAAYVARKFANMIITRLIRQALPPDHFKTQRDEKLREDTLISTVSSGTRVIVWLLAGMMLMAEFGVDIGPLVAGAGIAGVALGFGAQSMVKDFLAGMFVLFENQYRVGDVVEINQNVSGTVEQVTLRKTVLRDLDGMVHHIPNGVIEIATNKTMDFARVNLNIGVGYDTDIDKLEKVINDVGEALANDEEWGQHVQTAPTFRRVEEFADSAIMVKIVGKTEPIKQWAVTGELRRRLKKAFDKHNIEIPFPQRVIHQQKSKTTKK